MQDTSVADWAALGLSVGLLLVLATIGVFDFFMIFSGYPQKTVSEYINAWSVKFPFLPFLAGILAGHLWFR